MLGLFGELGAEAGGVDAGAAELWQDQEAVKLFFDYREAIATNASPPGSDVRALVWSRESLAFTGLASPESALRSFLWACTQGDLQSASACTAGPTLEKVKEWGADKAAPADLKASLSDLVSVIVMRRDVLADDAVVFTITYDLEGQPPTQLPVESRAQGAKFWMKRISGEWKISQSPWTQ